MAEERSNQHVAYRVVLLAAALLALALVFREIVTLLVAVLVTVLLAIGLSAIATPLERRGVPRSLAALAALLCVLAVLAGVLALVIPPFVDEVKQFANQSSSIVDDVQNRLHDITGRSEKQIGNDVERFVKRYTDHPDRLIGTAATIGIGVAGTLGALVIMLLIAFYIAARPDPLVRGLLSLFPPDRRGRVAYVMERLRNSWLVWTKGVLVNMLVTGSLLYLGFSLVGLDFAIVFAVFAALLVVVPYYGAIVAAIPPVLVALAHSPGKALIVTVVYVAAQQIASSVTVPLVVGRPTRLHPAVIAVGVLLVWRLVGFLGLFVAVPLVSAFAILVEELWVKRVEAGAPPEEAALPPAPVAPEEPEPAPAQQPPGVLPARRS